VTESFDAVVVGAGPTGLACGIELEKRGVKTVLVEKGCVVNSIYNYPTNMSFFTTPELLEIGNIPMTSLNDKPNRTEALKYYRRVADHFRLNIRQYERVNRIKGQDLAFRVHTTDKLGCTHVLEARKIVLATGYYDVPNLLNVPGEELDKVLHYYKEPHPYYNHDVVVVGAKNSAAIAALELWWTGARVTLIHRGAGISDRVKYWIRPNIENRIKNGEIPAYFHSHIVEIIPDSIRVETPNGEISEERLRLRARGISAGFGIPECNRNYAGARYPAPAHRSANSRERNSRSVPRRRHCGGHAHQRDLHRKRPLPRRTDSSVRRV
jgi:thioredoxin reductase (NADPH)